jgi:hypothetical protein
MLHRKIIGRPTVLFALPVALPSKAFPHCDGMDGFIVKAARQALATGNANLRPTAASGPWVQGNQSSMSALIPSSKVRRDGKIRHRRACVP